MLDASLATATAEEECAVRICVRKASEVLKSATSKARDGCVDGGGKMRGMNKVGGGISAPMAD